MYDYESLLGVKLDMAKKARILTRQSGSSHAMTLVACDTDENDKPVKWEFEKQLGSSFRPQRLSDIHRQMVRWIHVPYRDPQNYLNAKSHRSPERQTGTVACLRLYVLNENNKWWTKKAFSSIIYCINQVWPVALSKIKKYNNAH